MLLEQGIAHTETVNEAMKRLLSPDIQPVG